MLTRRFAGHCRLRSTFPVPLCSLLRTVGPTPCTTTVCHSKQRTRQSLPVLYYRCYPKWHLPKESSSPCRHLSLNVLRTHTCNFRATIRSWNSGHNRRRHLMPSVPLSTHRSLLKTYREVSQGSK